MALKIKLKKFTDASGNPTTAQLEDGEVGINPVQQKVFVNNSGTIVELAGQSDLDLSAVNQSILPDTTNTRDLGSATKRWRDIYLSSDSIDLAGATISSDGTGTIEIAATGATLPDNSRDSGGNLLAVTGTGTRTGGVAVRKVPFFSRSGGLSTKNASFEFNATIDNASVFTDSQSFLLSNGENLASADTITLFQF